jgi:hypothetical protein
VVLNCSILASNLEGGHSGTQPKWACCEAKKKSSTSNETFLAVRWQRVHARPQVVP